MVARASVEWRVGAVLLAAGGATRFREGARREGLAVPHKLLAPLHGSTVFGHALTNLVEAKIATIAVVVGAVELPELREQSGLGVAVLRNARWAEGQATSLALGVAWAERLGLDAVVCGLGDQPFIAPRDWRAVAYTSPDSPIAVATYGGRRRNPVRLARSTWALLPVDGDEGARAVIAGHPNLVVEVACSGNPADIDTPEDLLQWS